MLNKLFFLFGDVITCTAYIIGMFVNWVSFKQTWFFPDLDLFIGLL